MAKNIKNIRLISEKSEICQLDLVFSECMIKRNNLIIWKNK